MIKSRLNPSGPAAETLRTSGGVGRRTSEAAEQVSDDLRRRDSTALAGRRRGTALTLIATAALGIVNAYQTGLLRRVPEPRLPGLDADRVDAAGEAYQLLKTPDAALGIASYGVTLALLGAGASDRADTHPWLPMATAAKVTADTAGGLYLFAEQVTKHHRVCSWCTIAAGASLATLPAVLPEARAAWKQLRDTGDDG